MTSKVRIAYFIDAMNSIAGTEKQLIGLINKLNPDRFESHLFCLKRPSVDFPGINDLKAPYHQVGIKSIASLRSISKIVAIAWKLKKLKIDIVHTFFIDANIVGIICAKLAGVKVIVSSRRDLGFWHTGTLLRVLRVLNPLCKSFYVNSKAVKEFIMLTEKIPGEKIKVIYNGIDIDIYGGDRRESQDSPAECYLPEKFNIAGQDASGGADKKEVCISADDFVVGITANFSRRVKRIDIFLEAARYVLEQEPKVTFVIIGGGYLIDELVTLAKNLGIDNKIVFTGIRSDIPGIIAKWDVGTLSSDSEGLSNAIIEYMATGLPVVATDVGGNGELIENDVNGFLVPPGQPKLLAKAILTLLRNHTLRAEMGKRNREKAIELFLWDNVIKNTEDYYLELMAG